MVRSAFLIINNQRTCRVIYSYTNISFVFSVYSKASVSELTYLSFAIDLLLVVGMHLVGFNLQASSFSLLYCLHFGGNLHIQEHKHYRSSTKRANSFEKIKVSIKTILAIVSCLAVPQKVKRQIKLSTLKLVGSLLFTFLLFISLSMDDLKNFFCVWYKSFDQGSHQYNNHNLSFAHTYQVIYTLFTYKKTHSGWHSYNSNNQK